MRISFPLLIQRGRVKIIIQQTKGNLMKVDYLKDDNEEKEKKVGDKKRGPKRVLVQTGAKTNINSDSFNQDILIVVSKLKKYIKDKHGLNTSGDVATKLSDIVRVACDRAAETAKVEGRKTLMDRDF
jgi:UDP-N-acetylglucosamine transferase subunit ALG13